jgi:putative membrane protein insertion efficiency factor
VKQAAPSVAKWREPAARALLVVYKKLVSPLLHAVPGVSCACRFQPTCSEYAAIAIAQHGAVRGSLLAAWRVLRCNPLNRLRNGDGFDPVPPKRTADGSGMRTGHVTLVAQIRD